MRRAQAAIEYLFMLAAALVVVLLVAHVVLNTMRLMTQAVNQYIDTVRKQLLENM